MGSKWRKVKLAIGKNLCVFVPQTLDDSRPSLDSDFPEKFSDAALLSPAQMGSSRPTTPSPSSRSLKLSRCGSFSKQTCSICLMKMKQGGGHAIFMAECSHSFHFHCITSNVKHGNKICPVCRAKWKDVPTQAPISDPLSGRTPIGSVGWNQNNGFTSVVRRLPPPRHIMPLHLAPEPGLFDDDESLDNQSVYAVEKSPHDPKVSTDRSPKIVEIKLHPEISALPQSKSTSDFTVLVHLKAAAFVLGENSSTNQASQSLYSRTHRAPVDLVTVLDISGSMAGTKLALLKRAMGFLIQNLSSNDRLSVIAFSSTARRLFPLRRMTDTGRHQALQAVNSLIANGGTNIAEGLRKGAKVMEDRRQKNAVASIILLSDGQDTYTVNGSRVDLSQPNYRLLLPLSYGSRRSGFVIPVHSFGFGADHDASSMHSISDTSGGTFSFIETEAVLQDAFAQCIGGLLSVTVQKLQVEVECVDRSIYLGSLRAGSYSSRLMVDRRTGLIDVGDLYADEERDFLVSINVPTESACNTTRLLKVKCTYKDPITKQMATLESDEATIERPEKAGQGGVVSAEVDSQRNRLRAAEAMSQARAAAEQGELTRACSILENCRRVLSETLSAKNQDKLWMALDAELKEMQERMASRHLYEASGRAYILSGLSSHSWQRATARGDSTDSSSLVQAYQTPSMTEMLTRSQAMPIRSPSSQGLLRPSLSHGSQPKPR